MTAVAVGDGLDASPAGHRRGASAIWASSVANHFMNVIALSLFGADAETPWMKMPICAIAFTCFGTTREVELADLLGLPSGRPT